MNRAALKPLLNLAVAAVVAQSTAMPAWGEHLLSCGFTNALRIIKSADAVKRQIDCPNDLHRGENRGFRSVQHGYLIAVLQGIACTSLLCEEPLRPCCFLEGSCRKMAPPDSFKVDRHDCPDSVIYH